MGFSFRYPDDWLISDPEDTEGIVVSLVSPEQTVTMDVERDLPPPQIDFMSYGSARMRFFQQLQPSLEIVQETESAWRTVRRRITRIGFPELRMPKRRGRRSLSFAGRVTTARHS